VFHAKDGKWRVISIAALAAVGTVAAACSVLSLSKGGLARVPRRKRRPHVEVSPTTTRLQQITRYRSPDGSHAIHATLLAEFAPGDRSATLYIAFCPPFERLPTVEVEPAEDADATVKVTQLLHNGAELEVRLANAPDEKQSVTVELFATEPPLLAA
jgi:hypothetical protein